MEKLHELRRIWVPESKAGRKPRYRTIAVPSVNERGEGDVEAIWPRATQQRAATDHVIAVDIPIGLPDTSGRQADAEAR